MTQVASNTLTYDQIYFKIKEFYLKELNNEFLSNEERISEYHKIISDIYNSMAGPSSQYIPYIKGEPPVSDKFNKFTTLFSNDINSISKQIDYINAKTINAYNLFSNELESEKKFVERIASKTKVLQMYSMSPAEDIVYIGDSFDNFDAIDITKIPIGLNPNIDNGKLVMPIAYSRNWVATNVSIDTVRSNGFLGNDHEVIKYSENELNDYKHVYKINQSLSSLTGVLDNSPITYFEYGSILVDKDNSIPISDKSLVLEDEFCYLSKKKVTPNQSENELVNWSNFNINDPLNLVLILENFNSSLANSITISPYFGSSPFVEIKSILAYTSDDKIVELLSGSIFIGSSFAPINLEISKNYYYNTATIKFAELNVSKFEIHFVQNDYKDIEIMHYYWKPASRLNEVNQNINVYSSIANTNPFYGLNRFNVGALDASKYENIRYDKTSLIPPITDPNRFKEIDQFSLTIPIDIVKLPISYSAYAIVINVTPIARAGDPVLNADAIDTYFVRFRYDDELSKDIPQTVGSLASFFEPTYLLNEDFFEFEKFNSHSDGVTRLSEVINYFEEENNVFDINVYGQPTVTCTVNSVELKQISYNNQSRIDKRYFTSLTLEKELRKAKRKSIGIRDISVTHETYSNRAQIVSNEFNFDLPLETLMLSVDKDMPSEFSDKFEFNYSISADGVSWIPISSIQDDANGKPEVLVFNKNIPEKYQVSGIAYLNYPTIPNEVRSLRVKIEIAKQRGVNITPSIYSYQIIGKVKM